MLAGWKDSHFDNEMASFPKKTGMVDIVTNFLKNSNISQSFPSFRCLLYNSEIFPGLGAMFSYYLIILGFPDLWEPCKVK